MSYPELPGRAIPYHTDGTVVKVVTPTNGVVHSLTSAEVDALNDYDFADAYAQQIGGDVWLVFSFPEKRHLRGIFSLARMDSGIRKAPRYVEGSNDTTNGVDGTWTAAIPDDSWGSDTYTPTFDSWRYPYSGQFPGDAAYKVWRIRFDTGDSGNRFRAFIIAHLYGHKANSETPDDIIFVTPGTGTELTLPPNFHAVPAGSSSILQFALKNASGSKTAQNITLTVDDEFDIIRIGWSNNGPWEPSLNIDSLAAGAQSDTVYVKAEPPVPPTPLKPHRAPVVVTVGAWS